MNKKLVIVRHGHRFKLIPEQDNGLSPKGKMQAKKLLTFFLKKYKEKNFLLLSSPKKRCIETVQPISKRLKKKIRISNLLDEGTPGIKARIFFKYWKKSKQPMTVICSHGDFIPMAFKELTGEERDLKKGEWYVWSEKD